MPIYVYRCAKCGETFEEIQKVGAKAPQAPSEGCPNKGEACELERQMTTAAHRFKADYSSDGVGGYERQGDVMIRQIKGKNSEKYGSDRSGRG
jgi:putative FmdB family regulatory protein